MDSIQHRRAQRQTKSAVFFFLANECKKKKKLVKKNIQEWKKRKVDKHEYSRLKSVQPD